MQTMGTRFCPEIRDQPVPYWPGSQGHLCSGSGSQLEDLGGNEEPQLVSSYPLPKGYTWEWCQ